MTNEVEAFEAPATVVEVTGAPTPVVEVSGLPIVSAHGVDDVKLHAHIESLAPHPAYDDIPSLRLIFENGII